MQIQNIWMSTMYVLCANIAKYLFRKNEAHKKLFETSYQPSLCDEIPLSYAKIKKQSMP